LSRNRRDLEAVFPARQTSPETDDQTEPHHAQITFAYWNPLLPESAVKWQPVTGLEGAAEELTLSRDPDTQEYTRLTRFLPGADTMALGGKSHTYPEEVFIVSGRLYDAAFGLWLEPGHDASRPPGEVHGPFRTDTGCVILEVSFPNRAVPDSES
jgi:hypothetical protein